MDYGRDTSNPPVDGVINQQTSLEGTTFYMCLCVKGTSRVVMQMHEMISQNGKVDQGIRVSHPPSPAG